MFYKLGFSDLEDPSCLIGEAVKTGPEMVNQNPAPERESSNYFHPVL